MTQFDTDLRRLLSIDFPLLQAGMGGVASPELAAAVSNAGCLGVVALYKHGVAEVEALLVQTLRLTNRPFGVNLIPEIVSGQELALQVEATLGFDDAKISFTFFGLPPSAIAEQIKTARRLLLIQVGSATEAHAAAMLGADAVIVQGTEAGGHHLGDSLVDAVMVDVRRLDLGVPLIAAGGIASGEAFVRMMRLGAAGCMCGTLFVATRESAAHPWYKERVVAAQAHDTTVTSLFSLGWPGRAHRVLLNEVIAGGTTLPATFIARSTLFGKTYLIPRFSAAVPTVMTEGAIDQMAMYCGTSCESVRSVRSTAALIREFRSDCSRAGLAL